MPYDTKIEKLKADLIAAIGGGGLDSLHLSELWNRYLTSVGQIEGTLLDRMARDAASLGIPLTLYAAGQISPDLGPDLAAGIITDGTWSTVLTGATSDGTGVHFLNTASGTQSHAITTEDNVTYRIDWTISNFVNGAFRWQLYGATTAHLGQTSTHSSGGVKTEDVTTSAAGSLNLLIRANVTAVTNTMDITTLSVRKVL